jgi:hypothetical protein
MVKEEIVAGLKYAVAKGDSLPKAMMSFYNAGYSKQDIEEAARALQIPQLPQTQTQPIKQPAKPSAQPIKKPIRQAYASSQPSQYYQPAPAPVVIQRVSAYEKRPRSGGSVLMILLVFLLVVLFGILIAVFLFRDQLADFLGNIL